MVSQQCQCLSTGLKPGVNEKTFEAKRIVTMFPTGLLHRTFTLGKDTRQHLRKPFQRFPLGSLKKPLKWFLNSVSVFPPG